MTLPAISDATIGLFAQYYVQRRAEMRELDQIITRVDNEIARLTEIANAVEAQLTARLTAQLPRPNDANTSTEGAP